MLAKASVLHDIRNHHYNITIAQSEEDVEAALRLRFNVFSRELDRNFKFGKGIDRDEYDAQCHHLIVKENSTGEVIGTYRLQTRERAEKGIGFYTSKRFKLEVLPDEVLDEAVEVGRACIHEEHRNGRVLFLLWKGLAGYLEYYKKRYLFGYSALQTTNLNVAISTYNYLLEKEYVSRDYRVPVREEYTCKPDADQGEEGVLDIPPLFKNYLDVGTRICSLPAHDKELNLLHFMILLDVEKISDRTRKMFFG